MPFYQRNPMPPAEVTRGRRQARNQAAIIRAFFEAHPGARLTPPEVLETLATELGGCPLTSVRRALTDLTEAGVLTKRVDCQRAGRFGVSNCTWELARVEVEQATFWGE